MPLLDLADLAGVLLEQSAAALDAAADAGLGVAGAPARQVLAISQPVFDFGACEQLAVSVSPSVRIAETGEQSTLALGVACHGLTVVGLRVWLTGCVPTVDDAGHAPTAAALNASTVPLLGQGWALYCGLRNRRRSGDIFPPTTDGPKRSCSVGPLVPLDTRGGVAGWTIDVLVELDPDTGLGL